VRDARIIVDRRDEWAIGYSADGTRMFMTTSDSGRDVNIDEYTEVLRNGGTFIHNHPPRLVCSTLSTSDVLIAAALNLRQIAAVSRWNGRMVIISVMRADTGWKLKNISMDIIKATAGKWQRWYGDVCRAYSETWRELCPTFGCEYRVQ
jgi:hypothetical protein